MRTRAKHRVSYFKTTTRFICSPVGGGQGQQACAPRQALGHTCAPPAPSSHTSPNNCHVAAAVPDCNMRTRACALKSCAHARAHSSQGRKRGVSSGFQSQAVDLTLWRLLAVPAPEGTCNYFAIRFSLVRFSSSSSISSNSSSNSSSSSSNNNNSSSSSTPIDLTTNSGSSSNSSSSVNSTETERLAWLKEDGNKLDVKDTEDTWCVATVTTMKNHTSRTKKTQVFIHYDEYDECDHTYDEWFLLTSKRIARFRSMTAWYCTPIMQINPSANRWKIKGRITNISNMKTWSNAKGDCKFAIKDA